MLQAREIAAALTDREQDQKVIDRWGAVRKTYQQWHQDITDFYALYAGDWNVIWPDKVQVQSLPKIPNFPQLAADDRARSVAAARPSIICRPDKPGDKAQSRADKRERIIGGYWGINRVQQETAMWAHDAMASGLTLCRVLPDFNKPLYDRYPTYRRLEPALCFPDPIFSRGPFLDSLIMAYEENVETVEKRYGLNLGSWKRNQTVRRNKVRVLEYYDDTWVQVVVESLPQGTSGKPDYMTALQERHFLSKCPVVIGSRPTSDGTYHGEFNGGMGVLNYWNKMMTLILDDAISRVYSAKLYYDVENPEDYGPDALLEGLSRDARIEHVQQPNQPFSNLQLLNQLQSSARTSAILPPARTGDPNESVISAAGISAAGTQYTEDVRSIQRDIIAPMLEAANEMAMRSDVVWCDIKKSVHGQKTGQSYAETYLPSEDIGDYFRSEVMYGTFSGLDELNQNVMLLQQYGNGDGLISERTAMELSPLIPDVNRELKQKAVEKLERASLAGLEQKAATGELGPDVIAAIWKAVEDEDATLRDAITANAPVAPLAPPPGAAPAGNPASPGIAGAGEARPQLPALASLLGG